MKAWPTATLLASMKSSVLAEIINWAAKLMSLLHRDKSETELQTVTHAANLTSVTIQFVLNTDFSPIDNDIWK